MIKKLFLLSTVCINILFGYDSEIESVLIASSPKNTVTIEGQMFSSGKEYLLKKLNRIKQKALLQAITKHDKRIATVYFVLSIEERIKNECYSLSGAFIGQDNKFCMSYKPNWIDTNGNFIPKNKR